MSSGQSIYLASGNPHKVVELQELADQAALPLKMHSARELGGMPETVEDTGSFVGNAAKKARALNQIAPAGSWVIADDSGICVDALDGAPGVESAYFAGPEADDQTNLQKLITVMQGVPTPNRGAHYVCVLVLIDEAGEERIFRGECHGRLDQGPSGKGGFGYDPLFVPHGYEATFGVLPAETKQALSHRADAWRAFESWFQRR